MRNQNVADFRPDYYNGAYHLSGIHMNTVTKGSASRATGYGFVLNSSYQVENKVAAKDVRAFNMYEFRLVDEGSAALFVVDKPDWSDFAAGDQRSPGWVEDVGFREVEIGTGKVLFEWWALDHLRPSESILEIEDGSERVAEDELSLL